jgi:3-oxoadipate enol-lactonase
MGGDDMEDTSEVIGGMVRVEGHQYYWERHGVTERPTLVFLNGMASSTASWIKYLPFISDACDVILYDYLGQGKSDAPDVPYKIGQFADALDAILEANKVDKAWLVGVSYGGFVALEMMRLHADKVRGLFLSGVLLERARLFEMYLDLSLRWYRELPFEIYPDYLYEKMFSEKYVRDHRDAVEAAKHHIAGFRDRIYLLVRLMDAQRDWLLTVDEHRSEYKGKSIPAFVLAGVQDRLIPPWFQETAASALGATFETVPECAHSVYLEQTELFFERLRTFAGAPSPKG